MSELNDVFGFPQEDGQEPDFNAIFGGGEPTEAPPIPVEEPKTTDIPAAEIPAADVPTAEPHLEESAAAPAKETAKPEAPKTTKKAKSKTKEPEAEPDLFSAFNDQADTPEPPVQSTEAVPVGAGQVSLFDKAPIFSYGSAKEPKVFLQEAEKSETKAGRRQRIKALRAAEKERKAVRRREDKMLKSKKVSEEEKEAIRKKRAEEKVDEYAQDISKVINGAEKSDLKPKEGKEDKRARARDRKEEDKRLKSSRTPEEEKEAIRARRAKEAEDAQRAMADAKDAAVHRHNMDTLLPFTAFEDGCIVYGNKEYYGAAIEIDPVEFRFFSEHRRRNSIENGLGRILRAVDAKYSTNIVKLERPIRYEGYLQKEYDKLDALQRSYENGMLDEEETKARVEVEYDRINELLSLCSNNKVVTDFYYRSVTIDA